MPHYISNVHANSGRLLSVHPFGATPGGALTTLRFHYNTHAAPKSFAYQLTRFDQLLEELMPRLPPSAIPTPPPIVFYHRTPLVHLSGGARAIPNLPEHPRRPTPLKSAPTLFWVQLQEGPMPLLSTPATPTPPPAVTHRHPSWCPSRKGPYLASLPRQRSRRLRSPPIGAPGW